MTCRQGLAIILSLAASWTVLAQGVPSKYSALYSSMQQSLNGYEAYLDAHLPSHKTPVVFATELLAANGNRGEALLQPGAMIGVNLSLDRFQELGIRGVTVAVPYPLFDPAFPRHDQYVAFFRSVAQEVHSRGMTLDVENSVAFANTDFSSITWDWSAYSVASLAAAKGAMAQIVIEQVHPDILNLGSEPDTQADLTGMHALKDPATYAQFIEDQIAGLAKGNTAVGAGVGAWGDLTTATLLAQLPDLDCINFHLYPVDPASLQNSLLIAQIARAYGKRLILDEAWLYKMEAGDTGGVAASPEVFKRDSYSFFAPLDQQFLRCMTKLAQVDGIEFLSPFWSGPFFAYLPYSDALDAKPYAQVVAQENQAAYAAMQAGTFSGTGNAYRALIAQYPASISADFTFDPAEPTDATPVTFTAGASGGTPPYTYAWDFCGSHDSGEVPMETLPPGTCTVTLTVTDSGGLTAAVSKSVSVGYSVTVASVSALSSPFRLKITGSGFEQGCTASVGGSLAPQTVFKDAGKVVAKGGGSLKALVPKGIVVQVVVREADGRASAPFAFTR